MFIENTIKTPAKCIGKQFKDTANYRNILRILWANDSGAGSPVIWDAQKVLLEVVSADGGASPDKR